MMETKCNELTILYIFNWVNINMLFYKEEAKSSEILNVVQTQVDIHEHELSDQIQ